MQTCLVYLTFYYCLQDKNVLEEFSAVDQASTLQFTENLNVNGTLFQR